MKASIARLVTFGRGGDTVYCNDSRISGYGRPDSPHAAEPSARLVIPDGTPALDLHPALDTTEGFKWAFQGPMVDANLPENAHTDCPSPSPMFAAAVAGNEFGTLLALQECSRHTRPNQPGPLDSVSIAEYVRGWKDHGARVGEYQAGRIVWSD